MGKYGNIDGIATLTNNPIATDNAKGTIGKLLEYYLSLDYISAMDKVAIEMGNSFDKDKKQEN